MQCSGGPSLPLSMPGVPGGLFTAPMGSSMPSSIGFPQRPLYGGSPTSSGHPELFQRSSLPSGGSLPLSLPRSGAYPGLHMQTCLMLVLAACVHSQALEAGDIRLHVLELCNAHKQRSMVLWKAAAHYPRCAGDYSISSCQSAILRKCQAGACKVQ